jgi:hypothetical protein
MDSVAPPVACEGAIESTHLVQAMTHASQSQVTCLFAKVTGVQIKELQNQENLNIKQQNFALTGTGTF